MINDLWYKNAIVYCLSVGTYSTSTPMASAIFRVSCTDSITYWASAKRQYGCFQAKADGQLVNLLSDDHSTPGVSGKHAMMLEPYVCRWFRIGGLDCLLKRSET